AEARRFLLRQAGSHFPVHPDSLRSENGQVFAAANPQRRIGYGELLRGQRFNLNIDGKAPLKPRSEYRLVGKPVRRVDIPAKLTGQLTYVHDMRLPGMLHGRVVRPPYTGADVSAPLGSGLLAVDESS
ncbi:xanthine dehydrogenase family protein molybdopterin-binding subunit, partial [Pseudomonas aeruginosa]|nr:xanthine dehydrogenase family protein molybdopterin-binding subunit [Pseudomonas aeruginosa]